MDIFIIILIHFICNCFQLQCTVYPVLLAVALIAILRSFINDDYGKVRVRL